VPSRTIAFIGSDQVLVVYMASARSIRRPIGRPEHRGPLPASICGTCSRFPRLRDAPTERSFHKPYGSVTPVAGRFAFYSGWVDLVAEAA
jgi:hypothetical protein